MGVVLLPTGVLVLVTGIELLADETGVLLLPVTLVYLGGGVLHVWEAGLC